LLEAVKSLISQIRDRTDVELIIVDNDSTDQTNSLLVNNSEFNLDNVHLIVEKEIGLSIARNSGAKKQFLIGFVIWMMTQKLTMILLK